MVDFSISSNSVIVTSSTNGYFSGLLSAGSALATIGGTDFVAVTNINGNLQLVAFTGYSNVSGGGVIQNNSSEVVRITSGLGGVISLDNTVLTTMIYSMSATNADAAATVGFNGQRVLMLSTNGGILLSPGSLGLTLGTNNNDGFLSAGAVPNGNGELIFINNSANNLTDNTPLSSNGVGSLTVTVDGSGVVNFNGSTNNFNALYVNAGTANFTGANNIIASNSVANSAAVVVNGGVLTFAPTTFNFISNGNFIVNGGTAAINGVTVIGSNIYAGNVAGSRGVVTISTNVYVKEMELGRVSGAAGAVYQTAGTVNMN